MIRSTYFAISLSGVVYRQSVEFLSNSGWYGKLSTSRQNCLTSTVYKLQSSAYAYAHSPRIGASDIRTKMTTPKISDHIDGERSFDKNEGERPCFPARYQLTFMLFLGFFVMFSIRVNLSVTIVAMVNTTSANPEPQNPNATAAGDVCPKPTGNTTVPEHRAGKFDWDGQTQGLILSSFFYGVILTQIPGGWLAKKIGAKHPFGLSVLISGLLGLFMPLAANWHYGALIALRASQGLVQGLSMPAAHQLMGLWAPPNERSRMVMLTFTGIQIGTVVSLILTGVLIEHLGWESGFYFFGSLAFVWYGCWLYFAYESPSSHPRISQTEKCFIIEAIGHVQPLVPAERPITPWKQILTSLPVWAICVGNFGHNWGFYTLLTNIPSYLGKVLHYNIQANGIISAMPYLAMAVVMQMSGLAGDTIRKKNIISTTWIRRGFHFVGQVLPAGCLLGLGFIGCDHNAAVALLILALATNGISNVGFTVNHVDLSPKYAGILMGWSQTWGSIPGIVAPYLVGLITSPENTIQQWQIVFGISAAVYLVTCTFYALTASGERQMWEKPKSEGDNNNKSQS